MGRVTSIWGSADAQSPLPAHRNYVDEQVDTAEQDRELREAIHVPNR